MPKRPKNKDAVNLAAKRMTKLTPGRRKEIAQHAARIRWAKKRDA